MANILKLFSERWNLGEDFRSGSLTVALNSSMQICLQ